MAKYSVFRKLYIFMAFLLFFLFRPGSASAVQASAVKITDWPGAMADNNKNQLIMCPGKNGIYFTDAVPASSYTDNYDLYFYNVAANTSTKIHTFSEPDKIYLNRNGMYTATCSYGYDSTSNRTEYKYTIESYSFATGQVRKINLDTMYQENNYAGEIASFGVDDSGRIYVGKQLGRIIVFSASGKKITELKLNDNETVFSFFDFDSTNGNFYFRESCSGTYNGESVSGTGVRAGNFSNGVLKVADKNVAMNYFYGTYYPVQPMGVKLLAPGKLAVLAQRNKGYVSILDSSSYKLSETTGTFVNKKLAGSNEKISTFATSNTKEVLFAASVYGNWRDDNNAMKSYGPLAALSGNGSVVLVKTDAKELTGYDRSTGKKRFTVHTAYDIFTFDYFGNNCVILEKDGNQMYKEVLDLRIRDSFTISADSMKAGKNQKLRIGGTGDYELELTYSSSDPKVISMGKDGTLHAWKKGTAKITAKCNYPDVSKTITVKVSDSELSKSKTVYKNKVVSGTASSNIHNGNTDVWWGTATTSYLTALSGGGYLRVEKRDKGVLVEKYNSSLKKVSSQTIPNELSIYEGFFAGKNNYYLVFGEKNPSTGNTQEVVRVVKYDKKWKRISACSLRGINTYEPFRVGTIDMTEANGVLYIHTNHEMHNKHQANMTLAIWQETMTVKDSYYYIGDTPQGYVSHSCEQFVETDGTYLYRADLGDGVPRGVTLSITPLSSQLFTPSVVKTQIPIAGTPGFSTGFYLSGLELSEKNCLMVGTGYDSRSDRNVFLIAADKRTGEPSVTWVTSYKNNPQFTAPKLVKLGGDRFLLIWEETNAEKKNYVTKMVLVTGDGSVASQIQESPLPLSDCQPILTKNKTVMWYVTDNSAPRFIEINPYKLEKVSKQSKADEPILIAKGKTFKTSDAVYKVLESDLKNGTVCYQKPKSSKKSITIPDTVTYKNIKYKVTAVADLAFSGNTGIQKVKIGKNVTTIGKKAFLSCSSLTSVIITGDELTRIGDRAFEKCTALKRVQINSAKLWEIGKQAFYKDKSLKNILLRATSLNGAVCGIDMFKGINSKCVFQVPKEKIDFYKTLFTNFGAPKSAKYKVWK